MPIGLLGLIRLPAAPWVTNEWGYDFSNSKIKTAQVESLRFRNEKPAQTYRVPRKAVPGQYMALIMTDLSEREQGIVPARPSETMQKLLNIRNWKCNVYRAWWIVSIVTLVALGVEDLTVALTPSHIGPPTSVSLIAYQIMYLELCGGFLLITPVLVLRRKHTTTLIPCLQSWWYKLYTGLIILTALTAFIFASLETVQLPNGIYMSRAPVICHWDQCKPWNKTSVLAGVRWEWERFFNTSHIGA